MVFNPEQSGNLMVGRHIVIKERYKNIFCSINYYNKAPFRLFLKRDLVVILNFFRYMKLIPVNVIFVVKSDYGVWKFRMLYRIRCEIFTNIKENSTVFLIHPMS